jgi:hypothetical protein
MTTLKDTTPVRRILLLAASKALGVSAAAAPLMAETTPAAPRQ